MLMKQIDLEWKSEVSVKGACEVQSILAYLNKYMESEILLKKPSAK